jgi:hypothetical protein
MFPPDKLPVLKQHALKWQFHVSFFTERFGRRIVIGSFLEDGGSLK